MSATTYQPNEDNRNKEKRAKPQSELDPENKFGSDTQNIGPTVYPTGGSGPEELKQTTIKPQVAEKSQPLAEQIAFTEMEYCPHCDATLQLTSSRDVFTGQKIFRCKNCFAKLVKTNTGWEEEQN